MVAERTEGAVAFCTECGTPHEIGQRFCANCGNQLGGVITGIRPTATAPRAPISAMSIISFCLGIFSIFGAPPLFAMLFFLGFLGPFLLGVLAVVAGLWAHDVARREGMVGDALATAGIVLGVLGSIFGTLLWATFRF
jgi:hypothetical protein